MHQQTGRSINGFQLREPKVTFRIIRRCNFDCPGCSTFSSLDRKGKVRIEDFRRAIDLLHTCNFRGVLNISGGEPTFHEDLPAMLKYASRKLKNGRIALFTNGDWIGNPGWRKKLEDLFIDANILIRFSLDRQHAQGALRAAGVTPTRARINTVEKQRKRKGRLFTDAMQSLAAVPGVNFDFAFKGSAAQAREYVRGMGKVPIYFIRFRKNPEKRPKDFGFLAIDVQKDDTLLVYPTLGHIPSGEPLGGLESLPHALDMNREALKQ